MEKPEIILIHALVCKAIVKQHFLDLHGMEIHAYVHPIMLIAGMALVNPRNGVEMGSAMIMKIVPRVKKIVDHVQTHLIPQPHLIPQTHLLRVITMVFVMLERILRTVLTVKSALRWQ